MFLGFAYGLNRKIGRNKEDRIKTQRIGGGIRLRERDYIKNKEGNVDRTRAHAHTENQREIRERSKELRENQKFNYHSTISLTSKM